VQPQQQWSEEEEKHISWLIEHLNQGVGLYDDLINWLKSIKYRYTWKPNDEQMDVLLSEVTAWSKGCPKQLVLESLYNDLKKLREE
jgi:hypothetical protein